MYDQDTNKLLHSGNVSRIRPTKSATALQLEHRDPQWRRSFTDERRRQSSLFLFTPAAALVVGVVILSGLD